MVMMELYPLRSDRYTGMRNRLHGIVRNGRDYVDPVETDAMKPSPGNPCVEGCSSVIKYTVSSLGVLGAAGTGTGGKRVDKCLGIKR